MLTASAYASVVPFKRIELVPAALLWARTRVPPLTSVPSLYELSPDRVGEPVPVLMIVKPALSSIMPEWVAASDPVTESVRSLSRKMLLATLIPLSYRRVFWGAPACGTMSPVPAAVEEEGVGALVGLQPRPGAQELDRRRGLGRGILGAGHGGVRAGCCLSG